VPRDYALVYNKFWLSDTVRELRRRGRRDGILMAVYLITCRHANSIGIYYLPEYILAYESGLTNEEIQTLWPILGPEDLDFARYDAGREQVFVPGMAGYQIGPELVGKDKRIKWLQGELNAVADSPFLPDFMARYGEVFSLVQPSHFEAPSEGLRSPIEARDRDRSRERDRVKDREREAEAVGDPASGPASAILGEPVLRFGTIGNGPKEWNLTDHQVAEWRALYPALDVLGECRKAAAWISADPARRKTAKGMARFLVGWLNKAVDFASSRGGRASDGPRRAAPIAASSSDDRRSRLAALSAKDVA